MSGQPVDKQQLKNILVPAAAVAAIIVLIGLVVGTGGDTAADKGKPKDGAAPSAGGTVSGSADGMSSTVPPVDATEWKPLGERGLKVWDVKEGEGGPAKAGSTVTIHYTGWLPNGTVFDSSVSRGEPTTFPLGDLIQAWQIGIPGMKPGSIRRLYVPPALGYGAGGSPPTIPPNATLIFEVKLIAAK